MRPNTPIGDAAHGHEHSIRGTTQRSLWIALVLVASYMVVEVIGGLLANSMALLADAGHMVSDAGAIGFALLALWMSARPASARRTFGLHRVEVLAALLNGLSLWVIAGWIFVEAYRRFLDPSEVRGLLTLGVGAVGLLVNVAAALILRRSSNHSLNAEGAFLHVLGDLMGSVGVVASGVLIILLGWFVADPIFGFLIGVLTVATSSCLLWKVVHVLLEGTPGQMDVRRICQGLERVPGVVDVHDIHVWSISSGYEILSAHVGLDLAKTPDQQQMLDSLRRIAATEFGIKHVTIQMEDAKGKCEEKHHLSH